MVVELRMIQWMHGYTRLDGIKDKMIRERVGIAPIKDR